MKNPIKKLVVAIVVLLCMGLLCACDNFQPHAQTPGPTVVESIEINSSISQIPKGMSKNDLWATFSYRVNYSNGTFSTYNGENSQFSARLTCTPEYDSELSGVTYVFSLSYAGVTSNQVSLTVAAEPVALEISIPDSEIPYGLDKTTFLNMLTIELLMSNGSKVPYDGQWTAEFEPAFDTSNGSNGFSVKLLTDQFTSNELNITLVPATLTGIRAESDFLNGVPIGLSYNDFVNSLSVYAIYSNGAEILLAKADYSCLLSGYDSNVPGDEFTVTLSYQDVGTEVNFAIKSAQQLSSIVVEKTEDIYVVQGTTLSQIAGMLGEIQYIYDDNTSLSVNYPVLRTFEVGGAETNYVATPGKEFDVAVVAADKVSARIKVIVIASAELEYYPNEIPVGATIEDVKKFVKLNFDSGATYFDFELTSANFNTEVAGATSDFVVKYANSTFTFSAVSANISLNLLIETDIVKFGTPVEEMYQYFTLTKTNSDGNVSVIPYFALDTDYTADAKNGSYTFSVSFGPVKSNVLTASLIIEFDGFTFYGENETAQLVFPYGTSAITIKEALNIYPTLNGEICGNEFSINSPHVKYSATQSYLGRSGKSFNYQLRITIGSTTKYARIYIEGENTDFLGTTVSFDDGIFVKTPVSGELKTAPSGFADKYYYAIKDLPDEVYTISPLSGTNYRFTDARDMQEKFNLYLGYYIHYLNGLYNNANDLPPQVGRVEYSATFYHSLCASDSETATKFVARVKFTVKKVNTETTIDNVINDVFNSADFVAAFCSDRPFVNFSTKFIYSSAEGVLSVGDEIWVDVTGDERTLAGLK